jgi:acyl-CoA synthetase
MQKEKTLDELFSQAALKYPDNIVVTYTDGIGQEDLTYRELNKTAVQISSCLKKFCKLQNMIVGIYSRPIPGLIACMLGIIRITAAFAPIGLDWPIKMAKEFLETLSTDVKVVLIDVELLEKFKQVMELLEDSKRTFKLTECEILSLNGFALVIASDKDEPCLTSDHNQSLAYIMQTSGTTGRPKLVKVPHMCIVPNITSLASIFDITPKDSVVVISPYTFDPFIVQLFLALSSGSRAVIISDTLKMQSEKLCQILFDDLKISVLQVRL